MMPERANAPIRGQEDKGQGQADLSENIMDLRVDLELKCVVVKASKIRSGDRICLCNGSLAHLGCWLCFLASLQGPFSCTV